MKKMEFNSMSNLNGGSCIDIPGEGQEHRPFGCAAVCYASMLIFEIMGGNAHFDFICIA